MQFLFSDIAANVFAALQFFGCVCMRHCSYFFSAALPQMLDACGNAAKNKGRQCREKCWMHVYKA